MSAQNVSKRIEGTEILSMAHLVENGKANRIPRKARVPSSIYMVEHIFGYDVDRGVQFFER